MSKHNDEHESEVVRPECEEVPTPAVVNTALATAISTFENDVLLAHQFVNGGSTETVTVASGTYPTFANVVTSNESALAAQIQQLIQTSQAALQVQIQQLIATNNANLAAATATLVASEQATLSTVAAEIQQLIDTTAGVTNPTIEIITVSNIGSQTLFLGQPVYSPGTLTVDLAVANDPNMKTVLGLVLSDSITPGGSGQVLSDGQINGTVEQWSIVVNNPSGLIPNTNYFLDIVDGGLTPVPPTGNGQYVCPIGRAVSTTVFIIRINTPIQL